MSTADPPPLRIGTAGWTIPRALAGAFPGEGTHLNRYGATLSTAEINSSFHRSHRPGTYARWAASVPPGFRFAVKLPKTITHQHRLEGCAELLDQFAGEIAALDEKRGPVLVQLPPSLSFDPNRDEAFFRAAAPVLGTPIVCEPRHPSWFAPAVDALLVDLGIARVAADPAIVADAARPGGWPGLAYFRLHGAPVMYRSSYPADALGRLAATVEELRKSGAQCWVMFDNTASGAAAGDALALRERVEAGGHRPVAQA